MHRSYGNSKALFNFFKEHLALQIGMTSDTVVTQATSRLEKAINDCLREKQDISVNELDLFSHVKDDSEDRLIENIKLLTKYAVDDKKVELIRTDEVSPFFAKIKVQVKDSGRFILNGFKLSHYTKKMIASGNRHYFKSVPDYFDKKILSEAIYINREITKEPNSFFVSLDTHFSPARKDSVVRDDISKTFGIYCDWPEPIFKKIKEIVKAS